MYKDNCRHHEASFSKLALRSGGGGLFYTDGWLTALDTECDLPRVLRHRRKSNTVRYFPDTGGHDDSPDCRGSPCIWGLWAEKHLWVEAVMTSVWFEHSLAISVQIRHLTSQIISQSINRWRCGFRLQPVHSALSEVPSREERHHKQ